VINTDDRPQVVHSAPWDTYAPQTTPRQRLLGLVQALQPQAAGLLTDPASPNAQRLQAYWSARQRYLELGMQVQVDSDLALNRLQEPLLALLDLSADFKPARDALTALAAGLAASAPSASHRHSAMAAANRHANPLLAGSRRVGKSLAEGRAWRFMAKGVGGDVHGLTARPQSGLSPQTSANCLSA